MASSDAGVIVLGPDDNCVVAIRPLAAGETLWLDDRALHVAQPVGLGHKLARRAIAPGERVLKYGAPIGHATVPIARGEHIHLHNLASDWIPTWQPR
ncbi:MAG: UxaA family hydrolase [Ideonella sp.]|nr:UxaA family hydrolase [Ideonella sp.]MCC7457048.1 UxaA family hydrolase [Nitrospira sp.]